MCSSDLRMRRSFVPIVRGLSLTILQGESVALVGESGAGKSVSGLAIIGLIGRSSANSQVTGRIVFTGVDGVSVDLTALDP